MAADEFSVEVVETSGRCRVVPIRNPRFFKMRMIFTHDGVSRYSNWFPY